jgi:hypothetical protein
METYPGNDAADARWDALAVELGACERFGSLLRRMLVVVAPPDSKGLEGLPEMGAAYEQAEGAALPDGLVRDGKASGIPTLVVASSSLLKWNIGAVHELLHLVHHVDCTTEESARIRSAYRTVTPSASRCSPPLLPCNEYEFFAYTGQWFLAGYGDYLEARSRDSTTQRSAIVDMHRTILGDCRVSHGWVGRTEPEITSMIDWVLEIYAP